MRGQFGAQSLTVFGFQVSENSNRLSCMNKKGLIALLSFAGLLGACSSHKEVESASSRPAIYDAWDARYSYEIKNRRMVASYKGREVGHSWSRDPQGRLSESTYLGSTPQNDEDLFVLHQNRLDRMRTKQWESAKDARAETLRELLAEQEMEENTPLIEILIEEEEEEDFIPAPSFIPTGLDMSMDDDFQPIGDEPEGTEDMGLPFAPLP